MQSIAHFSHLRMMLAYRIVGSGFRQVVIRVGFQVFLIVNKLLFSYSRTQARVREPNTSERKNTRFMGEPGILFKRPGTMTGRTLSGGLGLGPCLSPFALNRVPGVFPVNNSACIPPNVFVAAAGEDVIGVLTRRAMNVRTVDDDLV